MKGLFISLDHIIDLELDKSNVSNGIVRKIICEIEALKSANFDVDLFCPYKGRPHFLHAVLRRMPFSGLIPIGCKILKKISQYDFIYVRSPWFLNSDLPRFLCKMKKKNPKIVILYEVPTYPGEGEANHFHMLPLKLKNSLAVKKLKKCVDKIVTYSKDKSIYGIPTIITSNAIDTNVIKRNTSFVKKDKCINLIACSSMAFWHGYDRAIEGMHMYFNLSKEREYDIKLYLVGKGEELDNYKRMIELKNLKDKVIICGYKSGIELNQLYNMSDIALDSLGRHRSKIFYNSSLKGKEYCARGLPIISGVSTELDDDNSFKYYLRIPADDTPLNIDDVVSFYKQVYENGMNRAQVIDEISNYAEKHFTYSICFRPIVEYIRGNSR